MSLFWWERGDLNPHDLERSTDFKSVASAGSATLPCFYKVEAAPRFELGIKVLQTSALPLGYAAIKTNGAEDGI